MSRQQVEGYFFCLYAPMGKFYIFIKRTRNLPEDNSVAQIIWDGNKTGKTFGTVISRGAERLREIAFQKKQF